MALDPVNKGLYISWRKRRVKKKLCKFLIIIWELINYENIIQERLLEGKRVTERKARKGRKKHNWEKLNNIICPRLGTTVNSNVT